MSNIKGTNVIAPVVPFSTNDVHPSHEARYGKGGYRTVATIAERDAIPAPRLEAGMLVFVQADGKAYQLGADLATWTQFTSGVSSWNDLQDKPDIAAIETAVAAKVPLAGGAMDSGAAITFANGTTDSEIAPWGFGVELSTGTNQYATIEYNAVTVQDTSGTTQITPGHLSLPNGTQVMVGSVDTNLGGYGGLSLVCAVGYELNWQAGRLRNVQVGGDGTPQTIYSDSPLAWRNPGLPGDLTVNGDGITFPDSSVQSTAYVPTSQPQFEQVTLVGSGQPGATVNGFGLDAGGDPTRTRYYYDGITFADSTFQNTAWTGTVAAADVTGLATVATSGAYADLSGTPTLATVATSGAYSDLSGRPTLATVATSGSYSDLANKPTIPSAYSLPTASSSVLGGVKIGSGISIDGSGVISASAAYTLPAATTSTLGGVIVGTGLGVSSGTVSVTYGTGSGTACQGNDSRLSDARTPTDGSVTDAKITSGGLSTSSLNWAAIADWQPSTAYAKGDLVNYLGVAYRRSSAGTSGTTFNTANWQQITPSTGNTSSTLCGGADSRLSNARTPTAHASTHAAAGSDPLSISASQVSGLAQSATTDTTNASNISSGTVSEARLPVTTTIHPFLLAGM